MFFDNLRLARNPQKSFEFNVNMADAAAARREARRRRILENSHNRLQLISGKCGDEYPKGTTCHVVKKYYG